MRAQQKASHQKMLAVSKKLKNPAAKQREIDELVVKIQQFQNAGDDIEALMHQLHATWRSQFEKRSEAASKANDLATLNEGGQRFLEVSVTYQQDQLHFRELWQKFAPADKRTRLARNWEVCGEKLYTLSPNKLTPCHRGKFSRIRYLKKNVPPGSI